MTNIILEKTYAKCGGETTPTPIPKNKIKHIFGSTAWNFIQFLLYIQIEKYQNILRLRCWTLVFTSLHEKCPHSELFWSAFSRIQCECGKMRTRITPNTDTFYAMPLIRLLVSQPQFLHDFSKKIFLTLYSINWSNFFLWLPLFLDNGRLVYCNYLFPSIFKLTFFIKSFSYMTKKVRAKI